MAGEIQKRNPIFHPPADLSDLRLRPAVQVWEDFRNSNIETILNIGNLSSNEVGSLARRVTSQIEEAIGMARPGNGVGSELSASKLDAARDYLDIPGDRTIFMRHGEQSPYQWISEYSDPTVRKIRMMQNPYNSADPLTNRGFIDVFATAVGLLHLQKASGRVLTILSSGYRRADEVGRIITEVVPGTSFAHKPGLESISYKSEQDDPTMTLERLYRELPQGGHMPWEPALVEKYCRRTSLGGSPSQAVKGVVAEIISDEKPKGNQLTIAVTHSQQIAEVLRIRGVMPNTSIRFPELSMIAIAPAAVNIAERGLLKEGKGTSVA